MLPFLVHKIKGVRLIHKRARNHVLKTMRRKDAQECFDILQWYP